jgi:hypothetical protein
MSPRRPGPATDHEAAASSGVAVTVAAGVLLTATGTAGAVCYARWGLADDVSRRRSRAEGSTPRASKSTRRTTATDRPKRTEEQMPSVRVRTPAPYPGGHAIPRFVVRPGIGAPAGRAGDSSAGCPACRPVAACPLAAWLGRARADRSERRPAGAAPRPPARARARRRARRPLARRGRRLARGRRRPGPGGTGGVVALRLGERGGLSPPSLGGIRARSRLGPRRR